MTKKVLYFDTETTGLTENSAMVQVSGIIEVDGIVKEEFDIFLKPHSEADISDKALEVTGMTIEGMNEYPDHKDGYKKIIKIFGKYINKFDKNDKFIVAGQNINFDLQVLNNFFKRNRDNYMGSYIDWKQQFDTLYIFMAMEIAGVVPKLHNHKLETICKAMGIELSNAHNSLADIRATREVGIRLMQGLKKIKK
jgi:DNA polymerase-3 subunit epsilon